MVGDSVRGSLRDMTLDRLGDIDLALVAERFFPADLAERLTVAEGFDAEYRAAAPAILLPGSATQADSGARASQVNVHGIDERFASLFPVPAGGSRIDLGRGASQIFPSVIINDSLQRELGAQVGDPVLLNFRTSDDIPDDTLLGNKGSGQTFGTVRTTIVAVIPDAGIGRFGLSPHQAFPLNAYVALDELQAALEQEDKVNAVLIAADGSAPAPSGESNSAQEPPAQTMLGVTLGLQDLGLTTTSHQGSLLLENTEYVFRPNVAEAIETTATELGASVMRVQTYLSNAMTAGDRTVPYSTVTAIGYGGGSSDRAAFPALTLTDGSAAPALSGNQILLNEWTADDLGVSVGETVRMEYYVVGPFEELSTQEASFVVAGVVALDGLGTDRRLTPDYPGIEGTDNIADWDPPFPVDLRAIRSVDEAYWDEYGATPKAFVADDTAGLLWATRYGSITSIRLAVPEGTSIADFESAFGAALLRRMNLPQFGMRLLAVKADGLRASSGATDFTMLFISFSIFLIASAAMLVGLLFSLGVEARAGEIGLLLSVGFSVKRVRRQMLAEGGIVAAFGALLGLFASVGYGALMMVGLRALWLPAVGTPLLSLHVMPLSLAAGWAISMAVVLISIWWTVRKLGRVPATSLLKGSFFGSLVASTGRRRRLRTIGVLASAFALFMLGFAVATGTTMDPMVFGTIGFPLLVAGLATFANWCRAARGRLGGSGTTALLGMAARNSAWSPGRSILSVALVAFASFVIVTVAANYRDPTREARTIESGTGGYALYATSEVPIHHDLNSRDARFDLGFSDADDATLASASIWALRTVPGDDASCLNLYRPQKPRLLGVTDEMIARGGFTFADLLEPEESFMAAGFRWSAENIDENPWRLLQQKLEPGVIPALGVAASLQWILHIGLGDDIVIENELGEPIRLRIVGAIEESIFRSEILISERDLLEHFPSQSGYSTFLVETSDEGTGAVARALESNLGDYGFDATRADEKLAGFLAVQNTYLSTFQLLGGLGLLLGTVGLAIVQLRNVIERRAELATLRAFGYRRASLTRMVLAETIFLLIVGLLIGSVSALVAVAPRFFGTSFDLPWGSVLATLTAVLVVGMVSSVAAVSGALRVPLLPVLKGDR